MVVSQLRGSNTGPRTPTWSSTGSAILQLLKIALSSTASACLPGTDEG